MNQSAIFKLIIFATFLSFCLGVQSQVTIGSGHAPTLGALLELKTQQAQTTTDAHSDDNITSTKGGLLLPRVKLVSTASLSPFISDLAATDEVKASFAGLMVYNLNGVAPFETGIYVWDGTLWLTGGFTRVAQNMTIAEHPKAFSFYETGEETLAALEFKVNPVVDIAGNIIAPTFQWYQVTGNNVHVRVGTPIGQSGTISGTGGTTNIFTPIGVIKGTTRNANNTGFYKFYCTATANGVTVTSDIAEVAVGCGAKNNSGEWISFMCFNLGTGTNLGTVAYNGISIDEQINYPINSYTNSSTEVHTYIHTYIPGEEEIWGDLFQWGRIPDGHEKRQSGSFNYSNLDSNQDAASNMDIGNGKKCSTTDTERPFHQIKKGTRAESLFIIGADNWNTITADLDRLWRTGRFVQNDPCMHYMPEDGNYHAFWHEGTNGVSDSDACSIGSSGTSGWRLPTQDEWGAIYKGGTFSGSPTAATANTWKWNSGTSTAFNKGFRVMPDGQTTTLYLPISGNRRGDYLYFSSVNGYYWSSTIAPSANTSYYLSISGSTLNPANSTARAYGLSVRCIKHQ